MKTVLILFLTAILFWNVISYTGSLGAQITANNSVVRSGCTNCGTTAGTSTIYTLTLSPVLLAYSNGLKITVKMSVASGANPTLNVNSLGARKWYKRNGLTAATQIAAGELLANQTYELTYNSSLDSGTGGFETDIGGGGSAIPGSNHQIITSDGAGGATASASTLDGYLTGALVLKGTNGADLLLDYDGTGIYPAAIMTHSGLCASGAMFCMGQSWIIGWSSGNAVSTEDTGLARNAAGVLEINNATAGTYRDLKNRNLIAGGSAPSISGCSATIGSGSANTTGFFTSGTTGTCTVTLTFATTAPTGWVCDIHNNTTANLTRQTAYTTTTATVSGVAVTSDTLTFSCRAF
jgi:hypothetical protein